MRRRMLMLVIVLKIDNRKLDLFHKRKRERLSTFDKRLTSRSIPGSMIP